MAMLMPKKAVLESTEGLTPSTNGVEEAEGK